MSFQNDYSVSENARPFSSIPGPSKFQLLRGSLPGGKFHGKSLKEFGNICRKDYGDLFKLAAGFGIPNVVMSFNPDHFEKVFQTEGECPYRRSPASITYFRETVKKDFYSGMLGLAVSNDEDWKKTRNIVNPLLEKPINISILSHINQKFVERIKEIRNSSSLEVPDNFILEIKCWAFESIMSVLLNKELNLIRNQQDNTEILEILRKIGRITELSYELDVMPPVWKLISTPNSREMMSILEFIHIFVQKYIEEAKESSNNSENFLQNLLSVNEKFALVIVTDILLTGLEPTASALTGVLLCMAKSQDKQEILRQEILKFVNSKKYEITNDTLKSLPYLEACIKESLRLYPAGAGTARRTNQDLELDGYFVPKETHVVINVEMIMKESTYFSEPLKFIPERWLDNYEATPKKLPFSYLPFGFGKRGCIGKDFANVFLKTFLIKILINFKIEYNYPAEEVFTSYLLNTPKAPLRFKFVDLE